MFWISTSGDTWLVCFLGLESMVVNDSMLHIHNFFCFVDNTWLTRFKNLIITAGRGSGYCRDGNQKRLIFFLRM